MFVFIFQAIRIIRLLIYDSIDGKYLHIFLILSR